MRTSFPVWLACLAALGCEKPAPSEEALLPPAASETSEATTSGSQRFSPVRSPDTVHALEASGRLLAPPNSHAEVTLPLSAAVLHVKAVEGQSVERGTVLAEVAMPDASRAVGQMEGARLRSEAYRSRLEHLEKLQAEGLARGSELAEARARMAEANADEHEALAVLSTVESAGLRRRGNRYEVLSTMAGVVVSVDAPIGAMRGPSDPPLFHIAGGAPSRVEARFSFPLPAEASYELVDSSGRTFPLSLVSQAPEVMAADATRLAWFDAKAPLPLPQGGAVRVRVVAPTGSFVVPSTALVRERGDLSVRTRRAGLVQVQLLTSLGSEALVRGALVAEDVVAEERSAP